MISVNERLFGEQAPQILPAKPNRPIGWLESAPRFSKLVYRHLSLVSALILATGCLDRQAYSPSPTAATSTEIVIDGRFTDWSETAPLATQSPSLPEPEFQIQGVATQHNAGTVYFNIAIDRTLNFQGLEGTLELLLDIDSNSDSGSTENNMAGVDLIVQFTPPNSTNPAQRGMGTGVRIPGNAIPIPDAPPLNHATLDFQMAPTYASDQLEFSLSRQSSFPGLPSFFQAEFFAYKFVLLSKEGQVRVSTPIFKHHFSDTTANASTLAHPVFLPAKDPANLRLMSWNVEYGTVLKKPDLYARILRALNPDIILFQELTDNETPEALGKLLNEALPTSNNTWQVIIGERGGSIGCGVASRLPIQPVEPIGKIPYPNRPEWTVRALGVAATCPNGKQLLVTSIHLKCCGRIGSTEDETRLLEVAAINKTLKALTGPFDGMVIGGDLNLVGSYAPIQSLAQGLGSHQRDLAIVDPYRLDRRSNATWASAGSQFAPGRLDYLLLTEQALVEVQSFVLNTADLSPESLSQHSLQANDSTEASDHFPIIVDLAWKETGE